MKTNHRFIKLPAILAAGLFSLAFVFQPGEASAKDHWNKNNNNRGHQQNGYYANPNPYRYSGSKYNHNRYYYQPAPRYETYQGRRGYWQQNDGIRIFINL